MSSLLWGLGGWVVGNEILPHNSRYDFSVHVTKAILGVCRYSMLGEKDFASVLRGLRISIVLGTWFQGCLYRYASHASSVAIAHHGPYRMSEHDSYCILSGRVRVLLGVTESPNLLRLWAGHV